LKKFKILPVLYFLFIGFCYIAYGLFLPREFFDRNRVLKYLNLERIQAETHYHEMRPLIGERFYKNIFGPLPKNGEKIFPFMVTDPVGSNVILVYPYLTGDNVEIIEADIGKCDYLVYSYYTHRDPAEFWVPLKNRFYGEVNGCELEFVTLSRYPIPMYNTEVHLAKIIKKKKVKP